ncbi:MAG: T9SS type A sorting domain-containing protein [Cytophagales bacterium]|nr:T9SS type A sorting domain-containing protein [Cytophagales bacterium]
MPSGATIVSGQGTNSITVSFGTGVTGPISMTQTNTNGSTTVQLDVTSGVPATRPVIEGPAAVLENSNAMVYSVPTVAGVTYQWTVPAGVTLVSGQGTNAIVVDFGSNVRGDIGVSLTNPFGTTSASVEVSSGVTPAVGSITGLTSVLSGQTGVVYSIASTPGTSYQWTVPAGATIVSGQGTNSITLDFGTNVTGSVGVVATNAYGSTNASISISEAIPTRYTSTSVQERFKIYPNPSQQGFTLESSTAEVKVISIHGDTIDQFSHRLKSSFGENYPAGVYFIQLSNGAGETSTVRLVKIQ